MRKTDKNIDYQCLNKNVQFFGNDEISKTWDEAKESKQISKKYLKSKHSNKVHSFYKGYFMVSKRVIVDIKTIDWIMQIASGIEVCIFISWVFWDNVK